MSLIEELKLGNFRSYASVAMSDLQKGLVVLTGANGAGKTNILEALSLFSPGRGLRGARTQEIQCQYTSEPWTVWAKVGTPYGSVSFGTGLIAEQGASEKRTVRINGKNERGQNAFTRYLSCIWLTPQMDRLFLDSSRERRKFLDRLVFAFDPGHAGRVTRYENALSQRSKLLRQERYDHVWLSGLEAQMAETGVAIAAARLEFSERLQKACENTDGSLFPLARLRVKGVIEELLQNAPALEVEEAFQYQLKQSRDRDSYTGGAATGPHKSDLSVVYASKNMLADQCSTGEQKALLIGLVMAHARLVKAEHGAPPILLLDEVAAHLDDGRRAALYDVLLELGGQCWMTGTEENLFSSVADRAQFFKVENAAIIAE